MASKSPDVLRAQQDDLAKKAQAHCRDSLNKLIQITEMPLLLRLALLGVHPNDLQDLVQKTWLDAFPKIGEWDPQRRNFIDWLNGYALNIVRRYRREFHRRPTQSLHRQHADVLADTSVAGPSVQAEAKERRDALKRILNDILHTDEDRAIIIMTFDGHSFADIGRSLGHKNGSRARHRFNNITKKIRVALKRPPEYLE